MAGLEFKGEEYWKQYSSIDIYNIMLSYIHEPKEHPERLTLCKILETRGETRLLYSLLVNTQEW